MAGSEKTFRDPQCGRRRVPWKVVSDPTALRRNIPLPGTGENE